MIAAQHLRPSYVELQSLLLPKTMLWPQHVPVEVAPTEPARELAFEASTIAVLDVAFAGEVVRLVLIAL